METKRARKTALIIALVVIGVGILTYLVSFLIRGYRPGFNQKRLGLTATGLLVADSDPEGASVYINDKLATATDDTINLSPEDYKIRIEKDGYLPWQKTITIKKEVVSQTSATLFRTTTDLKPLTNTGAINPTSSPDRSKIIYAVSQASEKRKNGVWLLDLSSNLPINRANTKQLTGSITNLNWQSAKFIWSPDNKNAILIETGPKQQVVNAFQINTDRFTEADQLIDVSFRLSLILQEWQQEAKEELDLKIEKLPEEMANIATTSATMINFSPDDEKLFYLAINQEKIPDNLIPHPPARSTQPEEREIIPGNIYVYCLKEDTNFLIGSMAELGISKEEINKDIPIYVQENKPVAINWLTSNYLLYLDHEKNEIKVIEADATNRESIYDGPFENGFVFPSPTGKSLITLTSLRPDSPGNLYEIKVR